jgi:hypothetical protein
LRKLTEKGLKIPISQKIILKYWRIEMSGYGRRSNKPKVEECNSLDANKLHGDGCLKEGCYSSSTWSRRSVVVSSIGLRASTNRLHLSYRSDCYGSEVTQSVRIERIPCRFGSWRDYFRCDCNRRVVKLYDAGRLFLCRHCYSLFHFSKNEGFWDQFLRQRAKHKQPLSGEAYEMPKPKGILGVMTESGVLRV